MTQGLKQQLLAELSRRNTDIITHYVEDNPAQLKILVALLLSHEKKISPRASWVLEKVSERNIVDVTPFIPDIILSLKDIPESGTRRTISKVLMLQTINEEEEGYVLDFCMNMLEDPKEPVAVKANCMTIIFNFIPKYPELKNEVFTIIEDQIPYNSVAFKARFNVLRKSFKL